MLEIIILILSIFQSIFGVGLLVIGTPLLLLLDYDFLLILQILLPCSILVSIFQIFNSKPILKNEKKNIYIALPFVFMGILILYFFNSTINFKLIVGSAILLSLLIKFFLKEKLSFFIVKNKIITLCFAGLFHGLTNTGGTIISIIFQELKKTKANIQVNIAYTYFYFATIQYISLNFFYGKILFKYENLTLLLLASFGYFLGAKIFKKLQFNSFINSLNFVIFFSGLYLVFSELK
tara:strand:- start:875 stop:1582 length:708 start_codon:yes stop_codon:yes gene_type:complete